jgi:hypothetical protein
VSIDDQLSALAVKSPSPTPKYPDLPLCFPQDGCETHQLSDLEGAPDREVENTDFELHVDSVTGTVKRVLRSLDTGEAYELIPEQIEDERRKELGAGSGDEVKVGELGSGDGETGGGVGGDELASGGDGGIDGEELGTGEDGGLGEEAGEEDWFGDGGDWPEEGEEQY